MKARTSSLTVLSSLVLLAGVGAGCNINLADAFLDDSSGINYRESSSDEGDEVPTDDKLLVSGNGEHVNVEYNTLVFPALFNYDSGLYYFAPDPEGEITGDKIVCASVIDEDQVEGDCFRQGHVCHFNYWSDGESTKDGKDVYSLGSTSCRRGGEVGPFLVPLESPMCGEDPFPACPTDDLFPTGPAEEDEDDETPPPATPGAAAPTA